ncbi:unnamed protein product [Oreochromis niloticus]|nr:unnamed protein product [Mustela putorius furo]
MAAAVFRSRGLAGVRNTNVLILIFLLSLVYVTNSLMKAQYKKKEASELDEKLQFLQSLEELIRTSSFFEDFPAMMDVVNSLRRFYKRTIIPSHREEEEKW